MSGATPGIKDQNGAYVKIAPPLDTELSIDELLKQGLKQVHMLLQVLQAQISSGSPSRDTVMNLKDCMAMLHSLKEKETELLENLSLDDLKSKVQRDNT